MIYRQNVEPARFLNVDPFIIGVIFGVYMILKTVGR